VAGRLSESQKDSVLLLEAGIEATSPLFNIPVVTPLLQCTELDWQYRSEPQTKACFGLENNVRSCFYVFAQKMSCNER
jgi:choline dehydrogenase-like flavoprotein